MILLFLALVFPFFTIADDDDDHYGLRCCRYLQRQINDLKQQINDIEVGLGIAYVTKNSALNLTDLAPNIDHTVMTLSLPEGKYIYNITVAASYSRPPNFDPNIQTYLDCRFLYDNEPRPCNHLGGMVNGDNTHALTTEDELPWNPLDENCQCLRAILKNFAVFCRYL